MLYARVASLFFMLRTAVNNVLHLCKLTLCFDFRKLEPETPTLFTRVKSDAVWMFEYGITADLHNNEPVLLEN